MPRYASDAERIERNVAPSPSGCWEWQLALDRHGYGQVAARNRSLQAHRLAYETFAGPIPEGMQIDHLCRNRRCVNPEHLEPVLPVENVRRSGHGAETTCKRNHPLSGPNLLIKKRGAGRPAVRNCRTCRDEARVARSFAAANIQTEDAA